MSITRYFQDSVLGMIPQYESYEASGDLWVREKDYAALEQQIAEYQIKLEKMAVENAGLKAICEDRRTFIMNGVQLGYIQVPTVEIDPALETIRVAVSPQAPTPATNAFVAEVRASGIDQWIASRGGRWNGTTAEAERFAAQLRQVGAQ